MIENYTTVDQSAELLNLGVKPESADMHHHLVKENIDGNGTSIVVSLFGRGGPQDAPCWSVGALQQLFPAFDDNCPCIKHNYDMKWFGDSHGKPIFPLCNSQVEACIMVIKWLLDNGRDLNY